MVEFLDGKPTFGVGFAMGIERLMELVKIPEVKREGYYIGALCEEAKGVVYNLVIQKRETSKVLTQYEPKSLKSHLSNADKNYVKFCVCIGEDELSKGVVWVKDLESKEEKTINLENF